MEPDPGFVYLNSRLVPARAALVPVFDRGFAYGDAIFETLKVLDGRPVFFDDHYQRLREGMKATGYEAALDSRGLYNQGLSLAAANGVNDGRLRILLSRGTPFSPQGIDAGGELTPTLLVTVEQFSGHPPEIYQKGVSCLTVRGNRGRYASIKSSSLMATVLVRREAHAAGAFEAIFTGGRGQLLEGSVSNVFFYDGKRLITAPESESILSGVTRHKVIDIAAEMEMHVSFEALGMDDINVRTTSVFLTGSVLGVCPVRQIDSTELPLNTELTGALSARLRELELVSIG